MKTSKSTRVLAAEGYTIDNHCTPRVAYKGPRFKPTEILEIAERTPERAQMHAYIFSFKGAWLGGQCVVVALSRKTAEKSVRRYLEEHYPMGLDGLECTGHTPVKHIGGTIAYFYNGEY